MAQKKNQLSEADAKLYTAMVVSVYGYLHEKSIAHRTSDRRICYLTRRVI